MYIKTRFKYYGIAFTITRTIQRNKDELDRFY